MMNISRADSQNIDQSTRESLLADFGVELDSSIATGTEAEVYGIDEERVLKIFAGSDRIGHLQTLKSLYDNLDTEAGEVAVPKILDIKQRDGLVAVVETRIDGQPLESLIGGLSGEALRKAEDLYLDAAHGLRKLSPRVAPERYMLFDDKGTSSAAERNFSEYYAELLKAKLDIVSEHFASVDPSFPERSKALVKAIRDQGCEQLSLVHGDFFPGNVMVDSAVKQIEGVIDFGSFTLFGDHLLDMAGAFSYYQMYEANRGEIRERMLPRVVERIGESREPRFQRFVLSNAILTSDLYVKEPDPKDNGHFQWAMNICSEISYWEKALS